jgi:tetratricopeptide (TPR) repeat protein
MILTKKTMKTFKRMSLFLVMLWCVSGTMWAMDSRSSEVVDFLPHWEEHLELFQGVEPKLKKGDRALYEKVFPLLGTASRQAIVEIEASPSHTRSPIFDFWLGNLFLAEGQRESAEQALKRCLRKFPNFKKAQRSLANLYVQHGDFDQARSCIVKVIELGGVSGKIYGLLAYTHFEEGSYQSALSAYRMARVFDHDHLPYRKGELYCLARLQKSIDVISLCEELLVNEPDNRDLWMFQVNAFLKLDQPLDALAILEVVESKGLAGKDELGLLARLYFNEELYPSAVKAFELAMAVGAPLEDFIIPLNALLRQSYMKEAQALLNAVKQRYKPHILERNEKWRLAEVQYLLITGAGGQAEEQCRQLLQRWPMSESGLMTLAQHLARKGDVDESRFFFQRAALLEKVQVRAWRELGRLAWSDGDAHSAIQWLEKVDQAQPSMEMKETIKRLRDRL